MSLQATRGSQFIFLGSTLGKKIKQIPYHSDGFTSLFSSFVWNYLTSRFTAIWEKYQSIDDIDKNGQPKSQVYLKSIKI